MSKGKRKVRFIPARSSLATSIASHSANVVFWSTRQSSLRTMTRSPDSQRMLR